MATPSRILIGGAICAALALSCFSPKRYVTPGPDGVNSIRFRAAERSEAELTAIRGAKDYCRDTEQQAVFLTQNLQYTGTMKEGTRDMIRTAGRAAGALGAISDRVAGGGGAAMALTSGEDYQADVSFRCE